MVAVRADTLFAVTIPPCHNTVRVRSVVHGTDPAAWLARLCGMRHKVDLEHPSIALAIYQIKKPESNKRRAPSREKGPF